MKNKKSYKYAVAAAEILSVLLLLAIPALGLISEQTPGFLYHRPRMVTLLYAGMRCTALGIFIFALRKYKRFMIWSLTCTIAAAACVAVCFLFFPKFSAYTDTAPDRANVFGNRKVMVIVPHEDDDVNLCSGVIEQYVKCGSDIYVVFATNGDFVVPGETRIREALACTASYGVPEDHVIFLGYGDQWGDGDVHIYNMPEDMPMQSAAGKNAVYGIASHPAFREGTPYTFGNYLADMQGVILQYRPDVIFCIDYDAHIDHRATSLIAEKAIGRILQTNEDYRPVVLKGYGYSTAWHAKNDFYGTNINATQAPSGEYMKEVNYFAWNQRLRLPVIASGLARSIFPTSTYQSFYHHKSQRAVAHADNVCNGDKVYWERSTQSLAYTAAVSATSGNAGVINDFMLHDVDNLLDPGDGYGVWIPEKTDAVKQIALELPEARDVAWIYLYDNPSLSDNVKAAAVILEDGTRIPTGALEAGGGAVKIPVNAVGMKRFTVEISETQGNFAGLSEIELYEDAPETAFSFVKLMDENEDFVYDYYMSGDTMALRLYRSGNAPELTAENYTLQLDNSRCSAYIEDGTIIFHCPLGQKCTLTVSDADGVFQDSVFLRNQFNLIFIAQRIEKIVNKRIMPRELFANVPFLLPKRSTPVNR